MMLANHTCMAELFKRALAQYDTIISRNAYLHQFRPEHTMFAEGNAEFDSCREVPSKIYIPLARRRHLCCHSCCKPALSSHILWHKCCNIWEAPQPALPLRFFDSVSALSRWSRG